MERHGPVPRKEGAKSSTHTNIHTHTRTRKETKPEKINQNILTSDLKLINSAVFLYIYFLTSLKIRLIFSFFFSLNVAVIFSHTFQTWSHSTRLQTTESHTHVSFPQTHQHRCSEGREGPRGFMKTPPTYFRVVS